jgi:hypothetical protein
MSATLAEFAPPQRFEQPQPEPAVQPAAPDRHVIQPEPAPTPASPQAEPVTASATVEPVPVAVPATPHDGGPQEVIEVVDDSAFLLEDVQAQWPQIMDFVLARSRMLYASLEDVEPINVEENTVVLLAKKGPWQQRRLEEERNRRIIERELSRALGEQCTIRVTADQQEEMPDARKQLQHVYKDELVRSALNIFDATIVAIDQPQTDS